MSLIRVLRTVQTTLTKTFYVDEAPTDASGPVTVTVKRLDGTEVTSGTATLSSAGSGTYTFALPAQPDLDTLTVDWSGTVGGAAASVRDFVEVVGGFYFGLAEARNEHKLDRIKYPTEKLAATRIEVEQECDRICRIAFVPRFKRRALVGSGTDMLMTPDVELRALRAVSVDGVTWTTEQLAAVEASLSGVLTRPAGAIWPAGKPVVVEYEHGLDYPPEEIRTAAMERLHSKLHKPSSNIPARAISFNVVQGGVYRLSTPSRERTGLPDVDAVYERHGAEVGGFA